VSLLTAAILGVAARGSADAAAQGRQRTCIAQLAIHNARRRRAYAVASKQRVAADAGAAGAPAPPAAPPAPLASQLPPPAAAGASLADQQAQYVPMHTPMYAALQLPGAAAAAGQLPPWGPGLGMVNPQLAATLSELGAMPLLFPASAGSAAGAAAGGVGAMPCTAGGAGAEELLRACLAGALQQLQQLHAPPEGAPSMAAPPPPPQQPRKQDEPE
jgi:hypothetical protein